MLVNGDFYGAILWNGDTSNVLMSLMSDGKEMRFFKSHVKRSDSTAGLRNELGSEFQTVGPVTEKARGCLMCCDETVDYDFTVPMSLLRSFQDHLFNYVCTAFILEKKKNYTAVDSHISNSLPLHVTSTPSLQTFRRKGWSRFCSPVVSPGPNLLFPIAALFPSASGLYAFFVK